jgi:DNA-binding MarR family transcriptional regulator
MPEQPEELTPHVLDARSLRGLAHPVRMQLLTSLRRSGPATASQLAAKLGESSGATSYHLRQLEKHGFVREVEGRGTGRERWWERVPGGITLSAEARAESESARSASEMIMREWEHNRSILLTDFLERGDTLGEDWVNSSLVSTANLRLTLAQTLEAQGRLERLIDEIVDDYRGRNDPGSRPVQMHINLFPVVSGEPTPDDPANDSER